MKIPIFTRATIEFENALKFCPKERSTNECKIVTTNQNDSNQNQKMNSIQNQKMNSIKNQKNEFTLKSKDVSIQNQEMNLI
jgi:hypothetical protein